ncbi:MAG TPA: YbhB/YbcL family Raf kinase inhibitor-like protein [Stellaceae bacterium]|nr:YbhB/YbcL family Raf kinase inhibitor-like protein [Stellaceae bacterium]
MKRRIAIMLGAAGCAIVAAAAAPAIAADVFTLTSPQLRDDGVLQVKNAGDKPGNPNCVGQNVSPPLAWHNPPPGTKSYALLMYDPEAGGIGFSHMVIYGIPAAVTHFAEGALSKPSSQYVGGKNGAGISTYAGPCTPPGVDWHHYTLTIVATDLDPKALPAGLTRDQLHAAIKGHVKASAGLIGRFRHP